jgi:hypothetical protein
MPAMSKSKYALLASWGLMLAFTIVGCRGKSTPQTRRGAALSFHILVDINHDPAVTQLVYEIRKNGPATQPLDGKQWFEVEQPDQLAGHQLEQYNGKYYVLAHVDKDHSMTHDPDRSAWGLKQASPFVDPKTGRAVVGFEFDSDGGKQFGILTETHINQSLAIVVDGKVIAAPNIQSRIESQGVITGDRSEAETARLVRRLNEGASE